MDGHSFFMEIVMYFNAQCIIPFFFQHRPHFKFTYVHKTLCRLMHFTSLSCFVFCKRCFNFAKKKSISFSFQKKISLNFGLKSSNKFANHYPLTFKVKLRDSDFAHLFEDGTSRSKDV